MKTEIFLLCQIDIIDFPRLDRFLTDDLFCFYLGSKDHQYTRNTGNKKYFEECNWIPVFMHEKSESLSKINEKVGVTVDQWTILSHSRLF